MNLGPGDAKGTHEGRWVNQKIASSKFLTYGMVSVSGCVGEWVSVLVIVSEWNCMRRVREWEGWVSGSGSERVSVSTWMREK